MKSQASEIDRFIGQRLKSIRLKQRRSLNSVAEMLRVSFQQVQKYEMGQNKISVSNLYRISKEYEVPLSYFFEGYEKGGVLGEAIQKAAYDSDIGDQELINLINSYSQIKEKKDRKTIISLLEMFSEGK